MTAPWDRRSPAEQARVRDLALASWLPQALAFAPHWSAVAERLGIEPRGAGTLDDLLAIPPSRESDVAAGGGGDLVLRPSEEQVRGLADPATVRRIARALGRGGADAHRRTLLEEYKPIHVHRAGVTGGLAVASTRRDLDRLHRAGARAAVVLGLDDRDYLLDALPYAPTLAWWGVHHLAAGSSMLALHPRGDGQGLEATLEAFDLVPVTAVAVRPDEATALADLAADAGAALERVTVLVTVGPPPTDEDRAAIVDAWARAGAPAGLVVRSLWAPDAGRGPWAECREVGGGLHTTPDLEHVEVLDGVTGAPGHGDGDLTLTTLGWHGTALVRYRTGAWVEALATDPCPGCGRTVPRIVGEIAPHAWETPVAAGGRERIVDLRGIPVALAGTPVAAWRAELLPPAAGERDERLAVFLGGDVDDATARRLGAAIEDASGLAPATVEVVADPDAVRADAAAVGSVFADLR